MKRRKNSSIGSSAGRRRRGAARRALLVVMMFTTAGPLGLHQRREVRQRTRRAGRARPGGWRRRRRSPGWRLRVSQGAAFCAGLPVGTGKSHPPSASRAGETCGKEEEGEGLHGRQASLQSTCRAEKADNPAMPYSVEGKLVVAISSRALFDFEDENRIFERDGEAAYIALQFARLDVPAREGRRLPAGEEAARVQHAGHAARRGGDPVEERPGFRAARLPLRRSGPGFSSSAACSRGGAVPTCTSDPLKANLFLSANEDDVHERAGRQVPGGAGLPGVGAGGEPPRGRSAHRLRRRRGAVLRRGGAGVPAGRARRVYAARDRPRATAAAAGAVQAPAGSAAPAAGRENRRCR